MNNQTLFTVQQGDKLGLALSGGGFRAALFHLGVLARLAERGLLHQLQVLSTVSGGSIIGAMYYLKLKQLLEGTRSDGLKPDNPKAYIILVEELERDFLTGVQTNLRMRALLNPFKNAKMLVNDDYSRSDRMSELYLETFYQPLWHNPPKTFIDCLGDRLGLSDSRTSILLKDLKITPKFEPMHPGENIRDYNQRAGYKIPILAINATTLNSGEHWVFTASSAGVYSAPQIAQPTPTLYPSLWFDDPTLTAKQREILHKLTLSDAVAASACVPSLFTPFAIHDLYNNDVVVELVDGGVFDNQGLIKLIDESCSHVICSDASGQLKYNHAPASGAGAVMLRSNDVMMERIRGLTIAELNDYAQRMSHATPPLTVDCRFWHLRDAFTGAANFPAFAVPVDHSNGTSDGEVYLLSALRTDLDAFANIEAHALMYDGYCLCEHILNPTAAGGINPPPAGTWSFLHITQEITAPPPPSAPKKLVQCLDVGSDLVFKAFRLMGAQGKILALLLAAVVLALLWLGIKTLLLAYQAEISQALSKPGRTAALIIGLLVLGFVLQNLPKPLQKLLKTIAQLTRRFRTGSIMPLFIAFPAIPLGLIGSALAFFHLKTMNPIYLNLGGYSSSKFTVCRVFLLLFSRSQTYATTLLTKFKQSPTSTP